VVEILRGLFFLSRRCAVTMYTVLRAACLTHGVGDLGWKGMMRDLAPPPRCLLRNREPDQMETAARVCAGCVALALRKEHSSCHGRNRMESGGAGVGGCLLTVPKHRGNFVGTYLGT